MFLDTLDKFDLSSDMNKHLKTPSVTQFREKKLFSKIQSGFEGFRWFVGSVGVTLRGKRFLSCSFSLL